MVLIINDNVLATTKDYLQYLLDQLSDLEGITYRQMMWEYILYYQWKIVWWLYDNRFLLKPTDKVKSMIPNLEMVIPYPWAKEMIYVDDVDNSDYLVKLIKNTYCELYWSLS